jgi:hypothetical protein
MTSAGTKHKTGGGGPSSGSSSSPSPGQHHHQQGGSPLLAELLNMVVPVTLYLSAKGLSFIANYDETKSSNAAAAAENNDRT